ncbi:PP2C family protein-serine/threonine phosphatase [Streptomyces hirsutus]
MQRAVLPDPPHRVGRLTVASRYEVAHAEAAIGGDLCAIHETPHGIRMIIADVRGKGLEAIRTVNALLGSFQEACLHRPDLPGVVRQLEERMRVTIEQASGAEAESFATAVVAELAPDYSELRIAVRGHAAPLLVHDGTALPLEPAVSSLPLGLGALGDGPGGVLPTATRSRSTGSSCRPGPPWRSTPTASTRPATPTAPSSTSFRRCPGPFRRIPDAVLDTVLDAVLRHTGGTLQDDAALFAVTLDADTAVPAPDAAPGPRHGHNA